MTAVFVRAFADEKATALLSALRGRPSDRGGQRFEVNPQSFRGIPGSPFAYWAPDSVLAANSTFSRFEPANGTVRVGVQTDDDPRFVRTSWETPFNRLINDGSSVPESPSFLKGDDSGSYYLDHGLLLRWGQGGNELKAATQDAPGGRVNNEGDFFRPGLSWALRTARFAPHVVPVGCIFSVSRYLALPRGNRLSFLALWNASIVDVLCKLRLERHGHPKFIVGVVKTTPVPDLTPADEAALATLARRAWSLKRSLDTRTETSHAFVMPALLQMQGRTLAARSAAWTEHVQEVDAELAAIQAEIDERCFTLYGIDEEDRRAITEGFGGGSPDTDAVEDGTDADTEDEAEAEAAADTATLAAELVSWAVGIAFGRFDVRLATGARGLPAEPEPFDPLPVCSPAMLTGADGLPLAQPPAGYPLGFPADGILVDDPGHPRDLTAAVRAVFDTVFDASADAVWQEAAALLDPKGHDLRTWLARDFFGHHLARHSKSRRKAPILWQLGPASASYSTWCYAHRLTRDSLFALSRDVVAPKLSLEERRQTSFVQEAGTNPTAKQRAELAAQDAVVAELRVFADEVRRVAPLWNPDLDDGIVLVEAPLWRLVPHKPWAKELKSRWDDLAAGKYDWAHLAMHLWPERVVPTCATDRSLAIAHGLEAVFWAEGADGKWTKRPRPSRPVDELVAERTSPAVKAALADLLAALVPAAGGRGRGRKGE